MKKLLLGLALALLPAVSQAQLRNVDLAFRDPNDTRVVGFHVYIASSSHAYGDWRDDINALPAPDASGNSHYALTGIEQFSDVYISLKSYDASGTESAFSNELVVAAEQQCLVSGCNDNNPCTVDTCTATGCKFDPAPLVGTTCNDGNAMTFNDVCQSNGSCAGTVAQCNADADCPAPSDVCAGPQSCVNHKCQAGTSPKPDETACNDGNAATKYDVCRSGVCRGFACGSDAQCSDGQACNGVETCVNNACVAGTPMVCDDGNVCNGAEKCVGSACVAGTPMQCPADDGPCFDSFCDPKAGCRVQTHPDGSSCQTSMSGAEGQCSAGVCIAAPVSGSTTSTTHDPRPPVVDAMTAPCASSFASATNVYQEMSSDAATNRKIVWSGSLHPMGSVLQYQPADGSLPWRSLRAVVQSHNGCDALYSVTLGGMDVHYRYRVSGVSPRGRVWSDSFGLKPGPSTPHTPFKFAFFAANGLQASSESTQAANVLQRIRQGGAPLVLGGGGYALSTEAIASGAATSTDQAVALWKEQAEHIIGGALFAPVLGSTEVASSTTSEAADYAEYMQLANTSQAPQQTYSYDFGGVHFVAVHAPDLGTIHPGTSGGAANLAWIDADLAAARANGARWLVVYMHSDLFSSQKSEASVATVRQEFGAIMTRHGVNLVLSGEGDSYERSKAVKGNLATPSVTQPTEPFVTSATDGVVFVRAGSGGRTAFDTWARGEPNWSAFRDNTHAVYLQLSATDKQLSLLAYGLDVNGKRTLVDEALIR